MVVGGKDAAGVGAPVEMIRHGENQEWKVMGTTVLGQLPSVGMKGLSVDNKFYILGRFR